MQYLSGILICLVCLLCGGGAMAETVRSKSSSKPHWQNAPRELKIVKGTSSPCERSNGEKRQTIPFRMQGKPGDPPMVPPSADFNKWAGRFCFPYPSKISNCNRQSMRWSFDFRDLPCVFGYDKDYLGYSRTESAELKESEEVEGRCSLKWPVSDGHGNSFEFEVTCLCKYGDTGKFFGAEENESFRHWERNLNQALWQIFMFHARENPSGSYTPGSRIKLGYWISSPDEKIHEHEGPVRSRQFCLPAQGDLVVKASLRRSAAPPLAVTGTTLEPAVSSAIVADLARTLSASRFEVPPELGDHVDVVIMMRSIQAFTGKGSAVPFVEAPDINFQLPPEGSPQLWNGCKKNR